MEIIRGRSLCRDRNSLGFSTSAKVSLRLHQSLLDRGILPVICTSAMHQSCRLCEILDFCGYDAAIWPGFEKVSPSAESSFPDQSSLRINSGYGCKGYLKPMLYSLEVGTVRSLAAGDAIRPVIDGPLTGGGIQKIYTTHSSPAPWVSS